MIIFLLKNISEFEGAVACMSPFELNKLKKGRYKSQYL